MRTLSPLKGKISTGMIKKLAEANFDYKMLNDLYISGGETAIKNALWGDTKETRVIKLKKILDCILVHFKEANER